MPPSMADPACRGPAGSHPLATRFSGTYRARGEPQISVALLREMFDRMVVAKKTELLQRFLTIEFTGSGN
jgi:hypothetical protein